MSSSRSFQVSYSASSFTFALLLHLRVPSQVDRKAIEVTKEIGRRVAQLRSDAGWSQKEFAAVLNSTVQWVSLVENGRQNLTIHALVRLAHKLGVEPRDLWDAAAPEPKKLKPGKGRPRGARTG